ncbi:MAG: 23S rRNA (adenine(2503)-C(2))-methyltransferase RlmN [Duncaniella sp.]|nr:23S rRNA (adenine(2503)-C(2))-methyltransferase RlmN [Duncaniella sp.]
MKQPLIGKTLAQLEEVATGVGLRKFAASQMARRLYKLGAKDLSEFTELPKAAREDLARTYCVGRTAPVRESRSKDGTVKYLFPAHTPEVDYISGGLKGIDFEAVYIPDRDRATLCVSSQAGCRMGCEFCMTGRQGFHGSLTPAAIINQVLSIPESASLTNIVFMGMGEPLDNVDAVLQAIEVLTAPWGLAWSPKRITVSSIGKMDTLRRLLDETKVHIAISVHSPFSPQRKELMPVERAFPIEKVFALLRNYDFAHQRRLSAEYILWDGVNDTPAHADALARLIRGTSCRVNLIRFHAIPGFPHSTAEGPGMERFRDRLNDLGVTATIRTSRGEDIEAACGMLAGESSAQ